MKVWIGAWDGPWGWRSAFYEWQAAQNFTDITFVSSPTEADIVFQCDLSSWRDLKVLPNHPRLILNVLDFAEWQYRGGINKEAIEYVEFGKSIGASFTAISNKVRKQLRKHFDVSSDVFYYPSQITNAHINLTAPLPKKRFITFARLADPGKAIEAAIIGFEQSGLANNGWTYVLVGPERPPVQSLPKGVVSAGYAESPVDLVMMIRSSAYVVMPSRGEGLGLPIIEGHLLNTPFIARDINPPAEIFKSIWDDELSFQGDDGIASAMDCAARDFNSDIYTDKIYRGLTIAHPWLRDRAFNFLVQYIRTVKV